MIPFALVSVVLLAAALATVLSKNLVHSVLALALTLVATAGIYLQLGAGFVAGMQVLLYAGGVAILLVFGVMLTRKLSGDPILHPSRSRWIGIGAGGALFAILALAVLRSPLAPARAEAVEVAKIGEGFLTEYVLPFEVLSVLLLGAMIGAIVIARKEDA